MIESLGHLPSVPTDLLATEGCFSFTIDHETPYLSDRDRLRLHVLLLNRDGESHVILREDQSDGMPPGGVVNSVEGFAALAALLGTRAICLQAPMPLSPVFIPKPWGREIWYSGIEERGVSTVHNVPIA